MIMYKDYVVILDIMEETNCRGSNIKRLNNKVKLYTSIRSNINKDSVESKMYKLITSENDFSKMETSILFSLLIYLSKLTNNIEIIKDTYKLYKTHEKLITELSRYLDMVDNIIDREKVYKIMLNFDKTIKTDGYYDSNIIHKIDIEIDSKNNYFDLEQNINYNIKVLEFKTNLVDLCKKLEEHNFDNNIKFNKIMCELQKKIMSVYRCFHKFNKPELEIYNNLIEHKESNANILYIFNHFTLPVSRNGRHQLYSDFLIVFRVNGVIKLALIEFDGPTHYNLSDSRLTVDHIYCDIIKNNYCIRNGIYILRVYDYDNYINKIDKFIDNICNSDNIITIIPSYEFYCNLLENIKPEN